MSEYRTRDLYFAAYLKVAAVPLLRVEREDAVAFFVFENHVPSAIKLLKQEYFSDQAKVHALSYAQAIREMKRLIHSDGAIPSPGSGGSP